jgi:hypothetical protein
MFFVRPIKIDVGACDHVPVEPGACALSLHLDVIAGWNQVLIHHATIPEDMLLAQFALHGSVKLQNDATHREDLVEPLRRLCRQFLCLDNNCADASAGCRRRFAVT